MKLLFEKFKNLNNLTQRIVAGLIGSFIMVSAITLNEWTFFGVFFIICFLSLLEFYNLLEAAGIGSNKKFGIISGMAIFTLIFLIEKELLEIKFYFLLFPFLFLLFLFELFRRNEKPFENIAYTFLGNIYIAVPYGLLHVAAFYNSTYGYEIILGIILLIWANDIGGYIAGMALGKNKLFFRISPKKTWEGSIGGGLMCILTGLALSFYFKELQLLQWVFLSIIITIAGSYGDLIESLFKRSLAVKDSGQLIPGHGGLLDRFDGLLLASPFIAAFLKIFFLT